MKIELKHLIAYLPYNVQVKYIGEDRVWLKNGDITTLMPSDIDRLCKEAEFKPILRPLSDLTKEIEHKGEKYVPLDILAGNLPYITSDSWFYNKGINIIIFFEQNIQILEVSLDDYDLMPYWIVKKLFEWHFDLQGLIPEGLAIDINTINP